METWMSELPKGLTNFLLVIVFSLLIGLSQRRLNLNKEKTLFGTDRTFTLIGLLGYLLYLFTPGSFALFMGGGVALTILFSLNYYFKVQHLNDYGITTIVTALITYCMGPLVSLTPSWMYVSVIVVVLLLTEMKSTFVEIAQKMDNDEFITLAKFLLIAFIILPMLPNEQFIPDISLTPYRIWLATVIVSGISYLSYLVKKYILPKSGVLVSGILGGLYSSTATLTILGKKCRTAQGEHLKEYAAAMFMAVGMMFLRLLIIVAIFNLDAFKILLLPMLLLMASSCIIGLVIRKGNKENRNLPVEDKVEIEDNPLEFKVALIFALLFIVFTLLTQVTLQWVGSKGLTLLAFVSGAGDITPFVLNLLDSTQMGISMSLITVSCLIATFSNNILKMFYAMGFSGNRKELAKPLFIGFGILSIINLGAILLFL
jgi:uncharacterized membrane protein (DUF4010 family)